MEDLLSVRPMSLLVDAANGFGGIRRVWDREGGHTFAVGFNGEGVDDPSDGTLVRVVFDVWVRARVEGARRVDRFFSFGGDGWEY